LLTRMRASWEVPELEIAAPAGYGKTSLLRQWATQAAGDVAWLTIVPEDNDPAVLLGPLTAALGRVSPIDAARFRTRVPHGTPVATVVAQRVAAAASSNARVTLVIDQTELLHHPQCREAIAELAARLPPTARLAVASRGTPPVAAARLRARGAIVEIGADDLAMDETEARALLGGVGVTLPDDELTELVRRTEGWPVGLRLAALARRRNGRHAAPGDDFTGDHRLMADY